MKTYGPTMPDYGDTRARLVAYLAQAGLSTARANANLDALLAADGDAQAVRDLHERRDSDTGSAYCDVCANHGDITWPCATIRALDGAKQ